MNRRTLKQGPPRNAVIALVAGLNTVAALAGALGLATGYLSLGPVVTSRLPWDSVVLGGVALGLLVAVPNAVLTVLAVRGDHRTGFVSVGVGALLVGWIVVELAFIRELSFFHPLYVGVGILLIWLGARAVDVTRGGAEPGTQRGRTGPR